MHRLRAALDVSITIALLMAAGVFLWKGAISPWPAPDVSRRQATVENFEGQMSLSRVSPPYIAGSPRARLVLLEFSDFECPFCARHAKETYPAIEREWIEPGVLKYVFRHFPLQQNHLSALEAAKAAHCGAAQGRFWEARNALFEGQSDFGIHEWRTILSSVSIDPLLHVRCVESTVDDVILADHDEGKRLGVTSTPTFFVGIEQDDASVRLLAKIRGAQPYDVFRNSLERAMSISPDGP